MSLIAVGVGVNYENNKKYEKRAEINSVKPFLPCNSF